MHDYLMNRIDTAKRIPAHLFTPLRSNSFIKTSQPLPKKIPKPTGSGMAYKSKHLLKWKIESHDTTDVPDKIKQSRTHHSIGH
jgi:hypothetical protein